MYRPYVSLDIETTGLGPEVDILQASMIFDEPHKKVEELDTLDIIFNHKVLNKAEPEGIFFNLELSQPLKSHSNKVCKTMLRARCLLAIYQSYFVSN